MLRAAASLAGMIAGHDWPTLGRVDVVVGLRYDGDYDWDAMGHLFRDAGAVALRRLDWDSRTADDAERIFGLAGVLPPSVESVSVPRDGALDFFDCDGWIVFANSLEGVTVPVRPIAIFCADLIQRHVPQIFGPEDVADRARKRERETFLGWHMANCVFATTPTTVEDVIAYAGVARERTLLVPTLIDPLTATPQPRMPAGDEILWVTNLAPHKNHPTAVAALHDYYARGGTLDVVVCGPNTRQLDPRAGGTIPAALLLASEPHLLERLRFVGEVSDAEYLHLISGAGVIWHNVIMDNGTFVAFDAARAGRLLVSSDYPQMRYLCERYGVDAIFHSASDPGQAAGALLDAERRLRAGERPNHGLRGDPPGERFHAYGLLLEKLLGAANIQSGLNCTYGSAG
jgi:glycosyltransferase involved in cell wall biosynthesis